MVAVLGPRSAAGIARIARVAGIAMIAGAVCGGCRAVLGIDGDRPVLDAAEAGPQEAPVEAGSAALNPFCSTLSPAAQRCADFEEGDPFAGWDNAGKVPNPGASGGGSFEELVEADGRKLLARTPAVLGSGGKAAAVLLYTMPSLAPRISVRADLKVITEDIPGAQQLVVMSIVFGDEGAVVVYRDKDGSAVAVVPDGLAARFPAWPAGAVRSIGIVVGTGANAFTRASVDGSWGPELALPAHFAKAQKPRIVLGPSVAATMGEAKISIDNVAIYWGAAQ